MQEENLKKDLKTLKEKEQNKFAKWGDFSYKNNASSRVCQKQKFLKLCSFLSITSKKSSKKFFKLLEYFIRKKIPINFRDKNEATPLLLVAKNGNLA